MIFKRQPTSTGADTPDDEDAPGTLQWLQAWYTLQCDGEWEHGYGISIGTLDNPGWHVSIDLTDTALAAQDVPRQEVHRSEHDWYTVRREDGAFHAYCGPLNLGEVLHLFRRWVQHKAPTPSN
jgi:hypothetical protein